MRLLTGPAAHSAAMLSVIKASTLAPTSGQHKLHRQGGLAPSASSAHRRYAFWRTQLYTVLPYMGVRAARAAWKSALLQLR